MICVLQVKSVFAHSLRERLRKKNEEYGVELRRKWRMPRESWDDGPCDRIHREIKELEDEIRRAEVI